jgi:cytochrome c oxidase subunit II
MKLRIIFTLTTVAITFAILSWWMGQVSYSWFPPQASAESRLIDDLFSFLVTLGTFIFLGVLGALTYSVLYQRAGKYDISDGPPIEGNVTLEIVWTAIPFILVMWIAVYSYHIYDRMGILGSMEHNHSMAIAAPLDSRESLEKIEVVARQWAWEFHYPQQNITSTELHLPNNQRIKLVLKSEDVLHGFYVPAFRVKQDIIPNRSIDFEFTPIKEGRYRLRDSQYSGTYFATMQTDVVVESESDYQRWLEKAALETPKPAYNRAFEEYNQTSSQSTGWKSVIPASPPLVNYSNSEKKIK